MEAPVAPLVQVSKLVAESGGNSEGNVQSGSDALAEQPLVAKVSLFIISWHTFSRAGWSCVHSRTWLRSVGSRRR